MALYPAAKHLLIPPGSNDPRIKPRVGILHVADMFGPSLYDYFAHRSGGIESHFYIRLDGTVEQYRDTDYQADANLDANDFAVSIETEGKAVGEWTARQLTAIKALLTWLHETHDIPWRKVQHWNGSGFGYHTLFGSPSHWTPVAKSCPGPARIKQFDNILVPWIDAQGRPAPAPAPAPVKRKPTPELTIITANFWRENKHAEQDAKTLAASHAHVIGLNEARGFYPILAKIAGYRLINPDGTGAQDQNPILLRADVKFLGQGARKMCDAVGPSPERWATWVLYEHAGQKRAHVNTHTNAHIENAGKPRVLPRVTQNTGHMRRLASLVRELRAQGYKVTVGGDLNWAWTTAGAWYWAPKRVFKRLGMAVNWEAKSAPLGGSKGNRRIDYLAHDPADLTIAAQCFVRGEHSDHRWPEVTYRIKA